MAEYDIISLADLKPRQEIVPIGDGKAVTIKAIGADEVLTLWARYPAQTRALFSDYQMTAEEAVEGPRGAIAAWVAAASGKAGDLAFEAHVASLPADIQVDLLAAVYRTSFTRGFAPFRAGAMFLGRLVSVPGKATDTSSRFSSKVEELIKARKSGASAPASSPPTPSSRAGASLPTSAPLSL